MLTFNIQAREALEIEHENERLEELYEIFAEGRSVRVDFAGLVTRQNGDLWLVSKVPVVITAQTDLRDPLRSGASDDELEQVIRDAVWRKELKHRVNEPGFRQPPRTMSQIGG